MMDKIEMNTRNRWISAHPTPDAKRNPYPPILLSPYTEKGGVKPPVSPLSEFGEGVGGGVKKLAGGFNPRRFWRRWYALLFALVMVFGVAGGVQGQEETFCIEYFVSPEAEQYYATSLYLNSFFDEVRANLQPHNIKLTTHLYTLQQPDCITNWSIEIDFGTFTVPCMGDNCPDWLPGSIILWGTDETSPLYSTLKNISPILKPEKADSIETYTLEYNPDEKSNLTNLITARLFYDSGRCELALPYFAEITDTRLSSVNIYATYRIGVCKLIESNYAEAKLYFEKALYYPQVMDGSLAVYWPEYYLLFHLAWTEIQLDLDVSVFEEIDEFTIPYFGVDSRAHTLSKRAYLYAALARFEDAILDLNKAIDGIETHYSQATIPIPTQESLVELYIQRGRLYLTIYEWDKALADYNAALELASDYADAYYYRGVLYASILQTGLDKRDEALADFRHYLDLAPDGDHAEAAKQAIADLEAAKEALNE